MPRLIALVSLLTLSLLAQSPRPSSSDKSRAANGPLAYTSKSIARGKQFYLIHCVECHDQDGKGLGRRDFNGTPPADLTDPEAWTHGVSPEAIFSNIREGTKDEMPPFKGRLQDEQIWHVVNFVRSLWPESKRPKLETVADPK
jgi:mono/diheme cytochrome c family protein